ncbi:class II glutamine amidotransferase [Thiohalocapsa marina]|uniref:Class II glutamine amidotransferase n=1 Tax=Thiohalocapsa marina TaxID=424902 RepID=A0A5M8FMX5_9GAMM|nr:class II glutamine amidotransferase [Thiohalocapsa marina]KAA6186273.1 class II glutamine amidotransferase [Thiohalocapsa marina]
MCELFALSSRVPATLGFSLERLARRGGADGPHRDGWGLAFYEGPDCLLLREPHAASHSALMRFMEQQGLRTRMAVSHIRLATFGDRALRNTQPFARELAGRMHVFAHNGDFPALLDAPWPVEARFRPIGDSDSELAFCGLLAQLAPLWDGVGHGQVPPLAQRMEVIAEHARVLRELGPANFIYADSDALFVHAHERTQLDGRIRPPGLYLLQRCCWRSAPELADSGVNLSTVRQDVALVASVPLTDELWQPLGEGSVIALSNGVCYDADGRETAPEQLAAGGPG